MCNKIYLGNTQTNVEKQMSFHFNHVRVLLTKKKSDSFASHFATHFCPTDLPQPPKSKDIREITSIKIIDKVKPVTAMKSFDCPHCQLCMKERLLIVKKSIATPKF